MEIFGGSGWFMTILLGGIAGAIGKLLMPGKDPGGFVITVLLGITGAVLMTLLGRSVGWYDPDEGAHVVAAIIGSVILLFIYRQINTGRSGPPRR
ncbi:MAG: hypothetical protein RLZZ561_456 [Pseudomonadota bacterium]|jgi:uncharacterized membrane protein YeaQ/YmgE (transglycosylase-associated protein family)